MVSLGLESVSVDGERLFSSSIPANNNLHWIFAGLPMSTHVHCGDNNGLIWSPTSTRHVPRLPHCFRLSTATALPFNWDWSNEQSAKFLRHIWQSVFIIKLKLAAPFSSSTADGPNTGTLFTTWQRMGGFCHDCLGYPLSFSPKMMHRVTESLELVECVQLTLMSALNSVTS